MLEIKNTVTKKKIFDDMIAGLEMAEEESVYLKTYQEKLQKLKTRVNE